MLKKISWHTTFGQIGILERTFLYKGHLLRPFCLSAGIKGRDYSLPLQRRITDFGADTSFSRASEKLKEHYGITIPVSSIRTITECHAKNMKDNEKLKTDIPDIRGVDYVITEVDGAMIPRSLSENALFPQLFVMQKKLSSEYQLYTCGNFFCIPRFEKKLLFSDRLLVDTFDKIDEEGKAIDKRKTRKVRWTEGRLTLAHAKGSIAPVFGATMGDKDDAGNQLAHCAILSGTGGQTKVHCVGGDGATWICDQVDRVFGPQATFLINFYHLCDYFSAASKTCAPDNPSAWIKEQKDRMKENNAFDVVNALKPHVEPDTVQDKDAPVRKCHRYIKNRHGQFDLKEGIFIDIGAHVGKYAIRLANRLGDKGEVIAIEPEENNFKILEKNAKHNKLENIHLLNVACFNKDGEIPLYAIDNYTTLHSIYRNGG